MPKKSSKPASTPSTARKARTRPTPVTPVAAPYVPAEEIARRAYELFVQHGAEHGRDLEHWLRAERELLSAS